MCDITQKLIIISGPSGAGKDTIVNELLKVDDRLSLSVSATTRNKRPGEKNGENYYFISEEEFLEKVEHNDFIEHEKYGAKYYGTLKSDVEKRIENGKTVILVIEVKGAQRVKTEFPGVLSIFIMPPSKEVLEKRLRRRMTDSETDIIKRMKIAEREIMKKCDYDYVIVNDELEKAVKDVYNIIEDRLN